MLPTRIGPGDPHWLQSGSCGIKLPTGGRFAQHSIEGGIVTEHVETETLSLVFHRGANYWLAHLSGDCNI